MRILYLACALVALLSCCTQQATSNRSQSRIRHKTTEDEIALRKAAQRLLGLRDIPSESRQMSHDFDIKMAPKYMLDLYEKYKDGRIRSGKQVANTVRSIQAEVGVINARSMFVFNLSSIFSSEKILKAEVHLYKRHVKKSRDSDIYMEMNELGPTFLRKLDHRRIPEVAQGWQAADVTSSVEACLHYGDGVPRMMALAFLTPRADDVTVLDRMNTRNLVRRLSRPYLIVYSNDTQNITIDHIQPHIQATDFSSTYVEPSTGILRRYSIIGHRGRADVDPEVSDEDGRKSSGDGDGEPRVESADDRKSPDVDDRPKGESTKWRHQGEKTRRQNEVFDDAKRRRRSVLDNEIPEDPEEHVVPDAGYVVPKTHPGILVSRTEIRRKLSRRQHHAAGNLIPYPEGYRKQRRKQRRQRRKQRKQREHRNRKQEARPFRDQWDLDGLMTMNRIEGLCRRRTLNVDFADIGWSEWIISPRSFEANYCSGSCPFPLAQRLKPSNHATIQSLVHAIGINTDVPGPCCVPDKLTAVTLLYFDENKNVVLKNYPEMSVESCSCR